MAGCEQTPQVPNGPQAGYPAVIKDSAERRANAEREWRRMLDAYAVAQTPPDLYPITYTPRSLLGVSGGIKIINAANPDPLVLREAAKVFIDRWRDLIGADPSTLSLTNVDDSSAVKRYTYGQAGYPFPVAGNYGEMTIVLGADGRLMQLDDRFIPVVEVPLRPTLEREAVRQRFVGRTFTYGDIAGREQRVQIGTADEVKVERLVVLPVEKGDSIEVRLAWQVTAGRSLAWTVYLDAVNGEELRVVQNFNT